MSWKQKEKELTPEEAIALAKESLARYWFGSSPLLAGALQGSQVQGISESGQEAGGKTNPDQADRDNRGDPGEENDQTGQETSETPESAGKKGAIVYPLDPTFVKKSWLIFFIDPTRLSGEIVLLHTKEWYHRYFSLGLSFLVILTPTYRFISESDVIPSEIKRQVEKEEVSLPIAVDNDYTLAAAFGATDLPQIILLSKGTTVSRFRPDDWQGRTELEIQKFLRATDPGLPLLPIFRASREAVNDRGSWELGFRPRYLQEVEFVPAAFKEVDPENRLRESPAESDPTSNNGMIEPNKVYLFGKWQQGAEKIVTNDPEAGIAFKSPAPIVSVVAKAKINSIELPTISVEIDGIPAQERVAGEHLSLNENGEALVPVGNPRLYHVLKRLPLNHQSIVFRFPEAGTRPIELYGLRFGE